MLTQRQAWNRVKCMVGDAEKSNLITSNNGYKNPNRAADGNVEFEIEGRTYSIVDVTDVSDYFRSGR